MRFESLPEDVLIFAFNFADSSDLPRLMQTSRFFYQFIKRNFHRLPKVDVDEIKITFDKARVCIYSSNFVQEGIRAEFIHRKNRRKAEEKTAILVDDPVRVEVTPMNEKKLKERERLERFRSVYCVTSDASVAATLDALLELIVSRVKVGSCDLEIKTAELLSVISKHVSKVDGLLLKNQKLSDDGVEEMNRMLIRDLSFVDIDIDSENFFSSPSLHRVMEFHVEHQKSVDYDNFDFGQACLNVRTKRCGLKVENVRRILKQWKNKEKNFRIFVTNIQEESPFFTKDPLMRAKEVLKSLFLGEKLDIRVHKSWVPRFSRCCTILRRSDGMSLQLEVQPESSKKSPYLLLTCVPEDPTLPL